MSRSCRAIVIALVAVCGAQGSAVADCTCRAQGREFELGQQICLVSPQGPRIATCGMVLNNTSWQFSETPCVVSERAQDNLQRDNLQQDNLQQDSQRNAGRQNAGAPSHTHAHRHGG